MTTNKQAFPRIERGPRIEVGTGNARSRKPGFGWVQGWIVKYTSQRESMPMRWLDALADLRRFDAVRVWDNEGKSADRFTVIYLDEPEGRGLFGCLSMNAEPFHPQGIGIHGSAMRGRHLGKRIAFDALPLDCQHAVCNDLGMKGCKP